VATAVCFAGLIALLARAQAPPPRAAQAVGPGTRVAVVDIGYIFKNHNNFKNLMEGMKKDVTAFEAELRKRGDEIRRNQEKLKGNELYKPGTPEYKRLEEEVADKQAKLQADTQLKRKEFLEREAKIYHRVYEEITREIGAFADRHRIDLVVRFNSQKIDPDNRQSVLEGVNRAVVFQRKLNITYSIVDALNRRSGAATPGPVAGGGTKPPVRRPAPSGNLGTRPTNPKGGTRR
jgi:Skp family chaperone for outer membrane proteins